MTECRGLTPDVLEDAAVFAHGESGAPDRPLVVRLLALVAFLATLGGVIVGVTVWG